MDEGYVGYIEKIKEIAEWMEQRDFTVSDCKVFFATAQAYIENSAPVKYVADSFVENYTPSVSSSERVKKWFG